MWAHPATQRNLAQLIADGVATVGPNAGEMAESGEAGTGRMAEPLEIVAAIEAHACGHRASRSPEDALSSRRARRTSRSIRCATSPTARPASRATRSRAAAAAAGADVTLVTGPVTLPDPPGVKTVRVETARDMLRAVEAALPADIGDVRRRGRRLARRRGGRAEAEEGRRRTAEAGADRKSRHPGDGRQAANRTGRSSWSASRPRPRR